MIKGLLIVLLCFTFWVPPVSAEPMGVLEIPVIGIAAPIVEVPLANTGRGTEWDVRRLGNNVGHLGGTSWVSQQRNIVLAGHVDKIFMDLHLLQSGDDIFIVVEEARFQYRVTTSFVTTIYDMSVIYPGDHEVLTLITCANYNRKTKTWDSRLIVIAERV